jgi:hypothetical protein
MSESSAEPDSTPAEETAEPEFANRAERRAKGKKHGHAEVFSKGQQPVGRGAAVQGPRQYGTRRSG